MPTDITGTTRHLYTLRMMFSCGVSGAGSGRQSIMEIDLRWEMKMSDSTTVEYLLAKLEADGSVLSKQAARCIAELEAELETVTRERNDALRQNERDLALQSKLDRVYAEKAELEALLMGHPVKLQSALGDEDG